MRRGAIPRTAGGGIPTSWRVIDASPSGNVYSGELNLFAGWYDVTIRAKNGSTVVTEDTIERVGVGDVFVIAGQSNSANHGSDLLTPVDDRVSAFDLTNWQHAADPQPIATGNGGSPWPALGDAIAADQGYSSWIRFRWLGRHNR